MKINNYIDMLKKEYKAKVIDFEKDIRKYFSSPDMYDHCGKKFDIELISEHSIRSENFKTVIIKGSNIDPFGKYEWGTKADIVFVEYDENQEVLQYCLISSFVCKDDELNNKFYKVLDRYKEK